MRHPRRAVFTLLLFALLLAPAARAADPPGECPLSGTAYRSDYASPISLPRCTGQIKKWTPCEVCMLSMGTFTEDEAYTKSYVTKDTLQPNGSFDQAAGPSIKVEGFFDGLVAGTDPRRQAIFRVRFTPTVGSGNVHISLASFDPGLAMTRDFTATDAPATATGFLRRDPKKAQSFIWDNTTLTRPFLWGQTLYQIIDYARLTDDTAWHNSVDQSVNAGMNKLRLVVSPWFGDPRTPGASSKAFQTVDGTPNGNLNRDKLDIANWRALDKVTSYLAGKGPMVAELILFHDGDDKTSPFSPADDTQNARFARYVVARYAAFTNVTWSLANEYQNVTGATNAKWDALGCIVGTCKTAAGADPWFSRTEPTGTYLRPLSIHNKLPDTTGSTKDCFAFFLSDWPTHVSLQTRRTNTPDFEASNAVLLNSVNRGNCTGGNRDQLPVFHDEFYYIGQDKTNFDPDRVKHRAASWAVAMSGGFGSTGDLHGDDDVDHCKHGTDANPDTRCSPTLYTKWFNDPGPYNDVLKLTTFFRTNLKDLWVEMAPLAPGTSIRGTGSARAYGLEKSDLRAVYSLLTTAGTTGKYKVFLAGGGPNIVLSYPYNFYDPRTLAKKPNQTKRVPATGFYQFVTPKALSDTNDWVQLIGASSVVTLSAPVEETVWVGDALPAGAVPYGNSEGWNWIEEDPVPISEDLAHISNDVAGMHQHFFQYATATLPISTGNYLYAYVYLDPAKPPREVMLQWFDGTWEHRAYWGANLLNWGADNTTARYYAGPLPELDQWVRLQVPASAVGLEGHTLNGMAFSLFDGKATWDEAGRAGAFVRQCDASSITLQPVSQTIIPGASATLSVEVTGTGPFNYQFYQSPLGTYNNPTGISTATINTGPLTTTKEYWAEINDTCQGTFLHSDLAVITVQCTAPPDVTQDPTSRTTTPGQTTTLSVAATQAVKFQWYSGSTAIPNATNSWLTVSPQSTTTYWVHVTNDCGVDDSAVATVCVIPKVLTQPTPRTINPGQSTTLTVTAQNATHYQWYIGSAPSTATPTGTDSSSLTVNPMTTTSYWVRASNDCGKDDSTTVTVTVAPPPPAQITRMQSVSVLANSQNSVTATWTRPTQPGTFLVAVISGLKDPAQLVWTPPAGWQLAIVEEWPNVKLAIYYLANNAGARTSETFTVQTGYHDMTLYVAEYSGMMAVNPLDRTASSGEFTNNGYVQTGYTANTVQPKELVITGLSTYTQTEFTVAPTDGYTELYDQYMLYHLTTAMYEKITTSTGSYGHSATVYVPAEWVGVVATFRAANTN